jgi:hypothetical protein
MFPNSYEHNVDNKKLKSALEVVFGRHLLSFEDTSKVATVLSP